MSCLGAIVRKTRNRGGTGNLGPTSRLLLRDLLIGARDSLQRAGMTVDVLLVYSLKLSNETGKARPLKCGGVARFARRVDNGALTTLTLLST